MGGWRLLLLTLKGGIFMLSSKIELMKMQMKSSSVWVLHMKKESSPLGL